MTTVRLRPDLRRRLKEEAEKKGFKSLNDAINAAVEDFVSEGKPIWRDRKEARAFFAKKKRILKGFEEAHGEEDI